MPATAPTNSSCACRAPATRRSRGAGGGIVSTVAATRAASEDELVAGSAAAARCADRRRRDDGGDQVRLRPRRRQTRCKHAARRAHARRSAPVRVTHHLPRRARAAARSRGRQGRLHRPRLRRDAAGGREGRACRCGRCVLRRHRAFRREQTARVFEAAKRSGLPVKLHADQLSNLRRRGARRANSRALSADHLEHTDEAGVAAMARGGHGRGAAAGRVLFHPRDAEAAGRAVPQARRADGDRHRLQSRHLAADLAAARDEHGRDAVPA